MLIHFNLNGFMGEHPSKLLEARAGQSLIFYPNSVMTKARSLSEGRIAVPTTIVQGNC